MDTPKQLTKEKIQEIMKESPYDYIYDWAGIPLWIGNRGVKFKGDIGLHIQHFYPWCDKYEITVYTTSPLFIIRNNPLWDYVHKLAKTLNSYSTEKRKKLLIRKVNAIAEDVVFYDHDKIDGYPMDYRHSIFEGRHSGYVYPNDSDSSFAYSLKQRALFETTKLNWS